VIMRLCAAARHLGPALGAVEVNPLWVNGDHIEALDASIVTEGNIR